ncbi:MAG: tyrosine-type recombinase/integrase [Candidatus Dormibacteraceae bacterium]
MTTWRAAMRVERQPESDPGYQLLDDAEKPVTVVQSFLSHLVARGCSPNTVSAYCHDLLHFWRFLAAERLTWRRFRAADSLAFLQHLRSVRSTRPGQRLGLTLANTGSGEPGVGLAASTINRALAAVSSFYEYLILAGRLGRENPMEKRPDPSYARVSERHQPFRGRSSRQRPMRRSVRVKTVRRLPRPLDDQQVDALLAALRRARDRALILLMLQGGLRPGEVLGLHLEDIAYGRRRVVVRYRIDHPKRVRPKSLTERLVDLHEPGALAAVSEYVMRERPRDVGSPFLFLVGGKGVRRAEPLGYDALVKLFARACEKAEIREAWMTPHALRHTHATRMWEGGMRELTLQKRLGHASIESTRLYTRVSDAEVVADYRRALGVQTS